MGRRRTSPFEGEAAYRPPGPRSHHCIISRLNVLANLRITTSFNIFAGGCVGYIMESRPSRQSLNHRASEQTLISLLELDPSPIDSPSPSERNMTLEMQDDDAAVANGGTTTAPGLSGNGHGAIYYCKNLQASLR